MVLTREGAGRAGSTRGVCPDSGDGWYLRAKGGRDPLTGRRIQVTKRGFRTAGDAGRARTELLASANGASVVVARRSASPLTVGELLDRYLDGLDADGRLSAKTRFDYRKNANVYVRPILGDRPVRDITPEVVLAWQRSLARNGGSRTGKPLAANTIRLARAPLAGAFKLALGSGLVPSNPMVGTPRPTPTRTVPRHWTPEQACTFVGFLEGDRTYKVWAILLGAGLCIGELVALRWPNVDLDRRHVRIVEFASTLGYGVVASAGKSRDAVRTIDLDDGLVRVLRLQRQLQADERAATARRARSRPRFHQARRRPVPPAMAVTPARHHHRRAGFAPPHRPRPPPHERHPHAGQRRRAQGRRGAPRPRRPNAVHQPLQPRHADHAAGGR